MNKLHVHINKMKQAIGALLCFLLVLQVVNRSFYLHSHKTASGEIVVHAHPFDKSSDSSPFKSHHHSVSLLSLLEQLETLFYFAGFILFLGAIQKQRARIQFNCTFLDFLLPQQLKGRAPPLVYFQ